jgi:hypothetical protein
MKSDIIFHGQQGLTTRFMGEFCFQTVIDSIEQVLSDPRFLSIKYWIVERTENISGQLNSRHIETIVDRFREASAKRGPLLQLIVAPGPYARGMTNVYYANMQDTSWHIQHFESLADAEQWLISMGLQEESAQTAQQG